MKYVIATLAALAFTAPAFAHDPMTQEEARAEIAERNAAALAAKAEWNQEFDASEYDSPVEARKAKRAGYREIIGKATWKRNHIRKNCCTDTDRGPMGGVGGLNTGF